MTNLKELEGKFGAVEFEGKKYILTDQADFTSRLLPDHLEGHFEMSAPAVDGDENEYTVYWIFENDPEKEMDEYDYEDVDRVVEN